MGHRAVARRQDDLYGQRAVERSVDRRSGDEAGHQEDRARARPLGRRRRRAEAVASALGGRSRRLKPAATGAQPLLRLRHVLTRELVAAGLPLERHAGARLPQQFGEPFGFRRRDQRVGASVGHEDRRALERRQRVRDDRHHGAKENRAGQHARFEQERARRDVGPVRKSDRDDARGDRTRSAAKRRRQTPPARGCEICRSSRSNTPSARRRKNRGMPRSSTLPRGLSTPASGASDSRQRNEVVFVAACAVQEQERRRVRVAGAVNTCSKPRFRGRHSFDVPPRQAGDGRQDASIPPALAPRARAAARAPRPDGPGLRRSRTPVRRSRSRTARRRAP